MADGSGAVFGIDGHIVVGEVAGPHGFVDIAPLQINGDGNFFLVHHCLAAGFGIIIRPAAVAYQADIAQIDFSASRSRSGTPARPTAARIRPQFGSDANRAVFTSGEWATV